MRALIECIYITCDRKGAKSHAYDALPDNVTRRSRRNCGTVPDGFYFARSVAICSIRATASCKVASEVA